MSNNSEILEIAMQRARELVEASKLYGVIVTIEQVPVEPLAMGRYESRITVRNDCNHYDENIKCISSNVSHS